MTKRYIFRKWDNTSDPAECWWCGEKTLFYIFDKKTCEDFFCCKKCAIKKYRIKRLKKKIINNSTSQEKTILQENSFVKNSETEQKTLSQGEEAEK